MSFSRLEALFPRASGRRLHVVHLDRVRGRVLPWRSLACKANLLSAVSRHDVLRLLQPSLHMLTGCLVSTGQRNWWSPSCRVVARPGVAPASTNRQLTLLTHLETRLEALFVDTPCQLISIFASRLSCPTNRLLLILTLYSPFLDRVELAAPPGL